MKHVYEIVDASCEETYWPGGIWPTFESAFTMLRERETPPWISGGFYDRDDGLDRVCEIQIRRHTLGEWDEHGVRVASVIWTRVWDEEADDDVWLEVKVDSTKQTLPEEMAIINAEAGRTEPARFGQVSGCEEESE